MVRVIELAPDPDVFLAGHADGAGGRNRFAGSGPDANGDLCSVETVGQFHIAG